MRTKIILRTIYNQNKLSFKMRLNFQSIESELIENKFNQDEMI